MKRLKVNINKFNKVIRYYTYNIIKHSLNLFIIINNISI